MSLDVYDIPLADIEQRIQAWLKEALELRHGDAGDPEGPLETPGPEASPRDLTEYLIRVRTRSDRVDGILASVTQARGRARRIQQQAKFAADLKYNEAANENATKRSATRAEFSTAKDSNAAAELAALAERRSELQANRLVSVASDSYDVVNQVHWQLDSIRKDIRDRIHALQFESSLER